MFLKTNAEKCHILLSPKESLSINVENGKIENVESEKLLGAIPDNKTLFYMDLTNICNYLSTSSLMVERI